MPLNSGQNTTKMQQWILRKDTYQNCCTASVNGTKNVAQ